VFCYLLPLALVWAYAGTRDIDTRALERLNSYRKAADLPLLTADPALSQPCQAHADYLMANFEAVFNGRVNIHDEDPKLPGYSEAGKKAAKSSVIAQAFGRGDTLMGIDVWMASFYHRVPLLDPGLTKVGIGYSRQPDGACFLVVDTKNGKTKPKEDRIMCYPVKDQKGVPCLFSSGFPENPNPIPDNGSSRKAGHPITVSFFADRLNITGATATLKDEDGNEVPVWLSSPEKPAVKGYGRNAICLIPKAPLQPNTTYEVRVACKQNGKEWKETWKFTTGER
jgi:hypothetical protein